MVRSRSKNLRRPEMSQDDSSRKLSPQGEVWKIFLENHEDEKKLREALRAHLREKAKNPPPMPPEIKRIPVPQLPKVIRATQLGTNRVEIVEWVNYYGGVGEVTRYMNASPKERIEIIKEIRRDILDEDV
jgi:hypothetical protein